MTQEDSQKIETGEVLLAPFDLVAGTSDLTRAKTAETFLELLGARVAFLDSISLDSLKDIRDKAIFSVLFYSWCRVSALINLTVTDYYERGGTRWLRFQEKRGKEHDVPVHSKACERRRKNRIKPTILKSDGGLR
jgi:integrase